jgi:hypothetical protein
MNEAEYSRRIKDNIGATFVVRLRFEAPTDRSVFVYAPYCGKPMGYTLERKTGRVRWLGASPNEDASKSPGFKKIELQTGSCWLLMTQTAAYEWETEIEPVAGVEEAKSVFVKIDKNGEPLELVSPWYNPSVESDFSQDKSK